MKCIDQQSAQQEKDTLYKIDSEHVIKLYGAATKGDKEYLLFEFCNGGDLYSFLRNGKRVLKEEEAHHLLKQII